MPEAAWITPLPSIHPALVVWVTGCTGGKCPHPHRHPQGGFIPYGPKLQEEDSRTVKGGGRVLSRPHSFYS